MHIAEVYLEVAEQKDEDRELIDNLTSAWRSHGQVLGDEFPVVFTENAYRLVVMLPRPDALEAHHDSQYVAYAKKRLIEANFQAPKVVVLGEDPFSAEPCACSQPSWFILYTNYVSLESSLRCGDCFGPLPLYIIPLQESPEGELHDKIMAWQSDYQSCDRLQMNCSTGEKFGLREMSQHNSSLSQRGREICRRIMEVTGVPTYYYLHRYRGRSLKSERNRKCPSCAGGWLLEQQLHEKFDFKCDQCCLLSNIALSLR